MTEPTLFTPFLFYIHKLSWGVQAKPGIRCHPLNPVMLQCQQLGNQQDEVENYTSLKEAGPWCRAAGARLYVKDIKVEQRRARHPHKFRSTDQLPAASIKEGKTVSYTAHSRS